VWLNPPPVPLDTEEMDRVFDRPFARAPHPRYGEARIPAWEMIRFSVNIMRGCFGGCTFCSITEHEGRIIQSRSEASILREIEAIRDKTPGFKGHVSDLGGPTANMYRMACKSREIETACRKLSCVYPDICENLNTDHSDLIALYRKARALPGIKKITIGSGLRYDLAVRSPEYVKELVTHHVSGLLKIAPEHTEPGPLAKMMKPGIGSFERFRQLFEKYSKEAGKTQHLVPYFIAAHPGTTDEDMLNLALWLKANHFRPDQVQNFTPTPLGHGDGDVPQREESAAQGQRRLGNRAHAESRPPAPLAQGFAALSRPGESRADPRLPDPDRAHRSDRQQPESPDTPRQPAPTDAPCRAGQAARTGRTQSSARLGGGFAAHPMPDWCMKQPFSS
jgi:uncharacterized radical SAM protein YgiQ